MNIDTYINNPDLIPSLTPEQKVSVYQQLQTKEKSLQQEQTKLKTTIELKQQEQQDLFQKLKDLTHKETLQEIEQYINTLQQQFDSELQSILTQYQQLQGSDK